MRYRVLPRQWGQGQKNFLINSPDAVAQLVDTRLRLWTNDWYLNRPDGTPWQFSVLGRFTEATRDAVVQARILQTPGVSAIKTYSSSLNRDTRAFTINALLDTIYGLIEFKTSVPSAVAVYQGR